MGQHIHPDSSSRSAKITQCHILEHINLQSPPSKPQISQFHRRHEVCFLWGKINLICKLDTLFKTSQHKFKLVIFVTFRGPCIVIHSYNESQRDALFLRFIWQSTLHVSHISTVRHQQYLNTVYTLVDAHCLYTVLRYSWWWTVDMSETCRVLYQINLRNSASRWLSL